MKNREIHETIKQAKGRLRPAQSAARQERQKWLIEAERLLNRGIEEEVITAIQRAGMKLDSPEARNVLRIWREYRR